ncbi:MAG: hypothetical protein HQL54_08095 [Magnetococcales bacterium]|nr:hypothetical protein [Magnetococcales bacterium]
MTGMIRTLLIITALLLPLMSVRSALAVEMIFKDDFNRDDTPAVDNGWHPVINEVVCEPEANPDLQGHALEHEIKQEMASKKEARKQAPEIQDQQLFLHFTDSRDTQSVYRDFSRSLERVAFDFMPLYAMGGMDDRAWIGSRIQFLDVHGNSLGEIRRIYHTGQYNDVINTPTIHTDALPMAFDGNMRRSAIEIRSVLEHHLTGVNTDRIARTRIILEIGAGWCGSTVESYVDNLMVFAAPSVVFTFTAAEVKEIIHSAVDYFNQDRGTFPNNWISHLNFKYGRAKVTRWMRAIPVEAKADPMKMADLMQQNGMFGDEAFIAAHAVTILIRNHATVY